VSAVNDASAVAAAVADDEKLKTKRSLTSTASWSPAAAAAAAAGTNDVRHHQSASETKHQRTSSLDNSQLTNVSSTPRSISTTFVIREITIVLA